MRQKKILITALFFFFYTLTVIAQPGQGQLAAEIALPSVKGDTLRLSALKGKVVLLDFWASWCAPCRISNRGLGKLYAKFRSKGFEIFGVSLDEDRASWQKAIVKDKVSWLQVIDPGGWNTPTARQWGIEMLPTSYLIDKEGRLIAMDLTGKELEKVLKEMLDK